MAVRPTLFISYRRSQAEVVRPLVTALEGAGIDCFFDQDDIDPLADFPERVRQGIDSSHAMLVWWSADYGDSDYCLAELRRAWQHARRRSSDVGRRIWVLNPEEEGHHIFAGELNAKSFLVPPAPAEQHAWAQRLKPGLDALLPEGPLADERAALAPGVLRNVPTPNMRFTGRGATLLRIHSKLFPPQIGAQAGGAAVWLHGMGGLGKTEVAAKYAHDFAHAFPGGVFWLSFAGFEPGTPLDPAAVEIAAYRSLEAVFAREPALQAKLLRDAEGKALSWTQARARVAAWLAPPVPGAVPPAFLWVLDNVPLMSPQDMRAQVLDGWKAPAPTGRTLLSTRDARVAADFAEERLEELGEVDALRLLSRFRAITEGNRSNAEALAREVGRHTIALMLLGHRVDADGDYAETLDTLLKAGRLNRLEQITGRLQKDLGAAARGVVATFELSIAPLSDGARRLLALASVCAPNEAIPRGLLKRAFGGDEAGDDFADAVSALLSVSLLGERRGQQAVDIHPLVADVAARMLGATVEREGEEIAQALLPRIESVDDIRTHSAIGDDIVHARHVYVGLESECGVRLRLRVGGFEIARGQYFAARQAQAAAREISRRVLGEEHPFTLNSMSDLAETLTAQGELPAARVLHEQVLAVRRRVLGEEHPDTLTSMNNVAETLSAQGDLPAARALHEQVLAVCRRVLGEEHPDTLRSMNNLAGTLQAQGELPAARVLQEQVLSASRRVLGEEHPDTLRSMNNLASLLWAQGDRPAAQAQLENVLAVGRRVLGEEHPDTLTWMGNLAETLSAQGELPAARALQEQVLAVSRRVLGEEHPNTLTSINNLALTLQAQGDVPAARALQEEVLAVSRRMLGEEHPDTLTSMNNLGLTLSELGDLPAARLRQEQVLAVSRRVLGEEHPATLRSMNNLASTLQAQGDLPAARALQEQVLEVSRRVLGEEHPFTLNSMSDLAETLTAQGELPAARVLQEQVLSASRRVLGEEHPDTLRSMNNLGLTLSAQGELSAARVLHEQVLAVRRRVLGEEHPATLRSMNNLASTLQAQADLPAARALQENVLAVSRRVLGEEHPDTLISMNNLGLTLSELGDLPAARAMLEQVLAVSRRVLGQEHPNTLRSMNNLASTLRAQGALPAARALQEQVLAVSRRVLGEEHPDTLGWMSNFAGTLLARGELAAARVLEEHVLAVRRRVLGEQHPDTLDAAHGLLLIVRKQADELAVTQLLADFPTFEARLSPFAASQAGDGVSA